MGLDYILAQTGRPWRKRWEGGLDRLKERSLLDIAIAELSRVVTADIEPDIRLKAGDVLIVQDTPNGLTVSDGLRSVGLVRNPTHEVTKAVRDCGGYAEGLLNRIGLFGDTAEIVVK